MVIAVGGSVLDLPVKDYPISNVAIRVRLSEHHQNDGESGAQSMKF